MKAARFGADADDDDDDDAAPGAPARERLVHSMQLGSDDSTSPPPSSSWSSARKRGREGEMSAAEEGAAGMGVMEGAKTDEPAAKRPRDLDAQIAEVGRKIMAKGDEIEAAGKKYLAALEEGKDVFAAAVKAQQDELKAQQNELKAQQAKLEAQQAKLDESQELVVGLSSLSPPAAQRAATVGEFPRPPRTAVHARN